MKFDKLETALHEKGAQAILEHQLLDWVESFGKIGQTEQGGVSRLAFGPDDLLARKMIIERMHRELGLELRIDAWGNIIGRRPGNYSRSGILMTGSHLDTVRNGGKFDGAAGIFCALEAVRILNRLDIQTRHPLEVMVFAAEEANQSGISTIGSRGKTGRLQSESLADYKDDHGVPLLEAVTAAGGNPSEMKHDQFHPGEIKVFIEIHNEQMNRLENNGFDLGIVTGVTGIRRRQFTVEGSAGHGGTILMDQRKDALVAAAELVTAVYNIASESGGEAVATVGHISVEPNSVNVVPGKTVLEMEIRSYNSRELDRIDETVWKTANSIEKKYGTPIKRGSLTYDNTPREFAPLVRKALTRSSDICGYRSTDLVSMAGHDAYHMSYVTNAGMIFVPSRNGLSHCPEEYTDPLYLARATEVLLTTLLHIDEED